MWPIFNPFDPNEAFLYPLKISEKRGTNGLINPFSAQSSHLISIENSRKPKNSFLVFFGGIKREHWSDMGKVRDHNDIPQNISQNFRAAILF